MAWPGNLELSFTERWLPLPLKDSASPGLLFDATPMVQVWLSWICLQSWTLYLCPLLSLTSFIKDMCQFFKNLNACRLWNLNIASKMIYKWVRLVRTLECVCVCAFHWTSAIHWIRRSKFCSTRRKWEEQWVIWFGRFWKSFCATGFAIPLCSI